VSEKLGYKVFQRFCF